MNKAKALLDYWYNLEFLSPLTKPIMGKSEKMGKESILPWLELKAGVSSYNFFFGQFKTEYLIEEMINAVNDDALLEQDKSNSYVCGFKLTPEGKYIEDSFAISPFIWAITTITASKNIKTKLDEKQKVEIDEEISDYLTSCEIIDTNALEGLAQKIKKILKIKKAPKYNGVYSVVYSKNKEGEEGDSILPSFYASDIKNIRKNITKNDKVVHYINALSEQRKDKVEIDSDVEQMKYWTNPVKYPLGKWPSVYNPSLMQQIAINMGVSEEGFTEDMFSVNGPPGTGKTTLLKEIIASNVVERANVLSEFIKPEDAFIQREFISPGSDYLRTYYEPDTRLEKYGILVASNNNNAVENLSKELPLAKDVKKAQTDLFNIDTKEEVYFTQVARKLEEESSFWGLISLAGGKKKNRDKMGEVFKGRTGGVFWDLYKSDLQKKVSWEDAKEKFNKKYQAVIDYRNKISLAVKAVEEYDKLKKLSDESLQLINNLKKQTDEKNSEKKKLLETEEDLYVKEETLKKAINQVEEQIPFYKKWFSFMFEKDEMFLQIKEWKEDLRPLIIEKAKIFIKLNEVKNNYQKLEQKLKKSESRYSIILQRVAKSEKQVDEYKIQFKNNFADTTFWENIIENETSQLASPWTDKEYDKLREELFYEALQLHEVFILNSNKVKQNISRLMSMWNGEFSRENKKLAYAHLLNTLMLVSPVLSTTFASVKSFLSDIGKAQLGMLVIDESGQATPHQALGAIWRTKKTIVVGDPLQVEPVVTVPKLIARIFADNFKIDDVYRPLELSVQVLADHLNRFGGIRKISDNELWLGCPLSVHRRSLDPMFSIANSIAYNNRMYNDSNQPDSPELLILKKSQWIDIKGKASGGKNHYVKEQGDKVIELILEGYNTQGKLPNVYIISPFKTVSDEMKRLLNKNLIEKLSNETKDSIKEWLKESCGTIHTFQGKEADEVILILGCDTSEGKGAANWAGQKPNILNVALTRAKYRLAIIGDSDLWKSIPYFEDAYDALNEVK